MFVLYFSCIKAKTSINDIFGYLDLTPICPYYVRKNYKK